METIRNFFKRVWEYIRKGYEAIARFFSDLIKKVLRKDDSEDTKKDNAKDLVNGVKTAVSSVSDDAKVVASSVAEEVKNVATDVVDIATKTEENQGE